MNPIIVMALGAMVLFGLVDFLLKKGIGSGIDGNALLFYSMLMAAVPFGFLCVTQAVPLTLENPLLGYSLLIGALMFLGTISLLAALKSGEASIVVPIIRLGFVVTAICAFIFLSEKITLSNGLGILTAILAILLLSRK
jgi:transporter family protein